MSPEPCDLGPISGSLSFTSVHPAPISTDRAGCSYPAPISNRSSGLRLIYIQLFAPRRDRRSPRRIPYLVWPGLLVWSCPGRGVHMRTADKHRSLPTGLARDLSVVLALCPHFLGMITHTLGALQVLSCPPPRLIIPSRKRPFTCERHLHLVSVRTRRVRHLHTCSHISVVVFIRSV